MKLINFYIPLFYCLFIFPQFLNAGEETKTQSLTFTVVSMSDYDVPDYLNKDSIVKIKNPLKNDGLILNDYRPGFDESINFDNCIKRDCVQKIRDVFPKDNVIIISINSAEVKIGQRRISRYMVEDITEIRYTLYVFTACPSKEKYELTFKRTFLDPAKLLKEAELIGVKIGEFYSTGKPEN